jgi:DhnA family fructose-bisphosphate aldolase class Ia
VVLGMRAHRVPFIVKLNHNELLSYPNHYDQVMFGDVEQCFDLGAAGVGATVYFGSEQSDRQLQETREAFARAHQLGMFTVLWCYLRNPAFKKDGVDNPVSADLTGQANHLGVTIEADIVKQKQPENNGGYPALGFGRTDERLYEKLTTGHPIDLTRWQVANCCMGASGSSTAAVRRPTKETWRRSYRTAVINKRAGGTGLITGRKAFQRPTGHRAAPRRTGRLSSTTPSPWPDQQTAPRRAQAHPRVGQGLGPHPLRPSARASDTFAYGRKAFGIAASWRSTRTSCEAPPTTRASGAVKGSTVTTT